MEAEGEGLIYQWYSCPKYASTETWTPVGGSSAEATNLIVTVNSSTVDKCYKCVITNENGRTVETNHVLVRNKGSIVTNGAMTFTL